MTSEIKLLHSTDGVFYANFNDIEVDGDIKLIDGEEKIRQEICKFILIQQGTTILFPAYGTNIPFLMNNRNTSLVYNDLKNELIYAVQWVQQINRNEELNIQKLENLYIEVVNERELVIQIVLQLTNGEYLRIDEKSIL